MANRAGKHEEVPDKMIVPDTVIYQETFKPRQGNHPCPNEAHFVKPVDLQKLHAVINTLAPAKNHRA